MMVEVVKRDDHRRFHHFLRENLPPSLTSNRTMSAYGPDYGVYEKGILSTIGRFFAHEYTALATFDDYSDEVRVTVRDPKYVGDLEILAERYEAKYPGRSVTIEYWNDDSIDDGGLETK